MAIRTKFVLHYFVLFRSIMIDAHNFFRLKINVIIPTVNNSINHNPIHKTFFRFRQIKRKIRNYVEVAKENVDGYRIYIKERVPLNRSDAEAYTACGVDSKTIKAKKKENENIDLEIRNYMCKQFYLFQLLNGGDKCISKE